jgi:putative inorganic carbon (HCO3(-)) transporter
MTALRSQAIAAFWYVPAALIFGLLLVLVSGLSITWLILFFLGVCFGAATFWSGNVKDFFFLGLLFTCSIDINKALIAEGGIYTPGLSLTLSDLFLAPLLILWIAGKIFDHNPRIYWSSLHNYVLVFLIWFCSTAINSESKLAGILMCVNYIKYFLIFVLLADYIQSPGQIRLALYGLAAAVCVHLLMSMLDIASSGSFAIQGTKNTSVGTQIVFENAGALQAFRPSGFMGHPNALADFLVFVAPPMFMLVLLGSRHIGYKTWITATAVFGIAMIMLVLTLSRAGWISFTAAALYALYIGTKRGVISRQQILALIGLATVAVMAIIVIYPAALLRITESDSRSSESRFIMMDQALLIIKRNPIFGVGLSDYNGAAHRNIPASFADVSKGFQDELLKGVVHNKYLLTAAETGLIGLFLFLLMLYRFISAVPGWLYWRDRVTFALALGGSASIAGQAVFFLFDHFYVDIRITLLFVFFGLVTAFLKLEGYGQPLAKLRPE